MTILRLNSHTKANANITTTAEKQRESSGTVGRASSLRAGRMLSSSLPHISSGYDNEPIVCRLKTGKLSQ
jgi:hypothetical protein